MNGGFRRWILLVCALVVAASSTAQEFGRNKVNYNRMEWETIRSEHFDLFYPKGAHRLAQFTAETAEASLAKIVDNWRYEPSNRIPIIVYTSHNTFSETNIVGGLIDEGTGGFTEFNRSRVVIPYEGSYAQLRHVIHHELVHAVQYDLFMSGNLKSLALSRLVALPLWAVEGLAEFESTGWDVEADNIIRDAVISDYVPPIEMMQYGLFAYKGGQALYRYLSEVYGQDRIATFLRSLKETANVEKSLQAVYNIKLKELDAKWKEWLKREYWPEIAERQSPSEFAKPLTNHAEGDGYLNVGGRLSPDGKRVAFVSTRRGFADVYLVDVATQHVTRVIEGEQSPDFESLFLLRPGLAWSPDGEQLAVVAKKSGRSALFLFDLNEGEVEKEFDIATDAAFTPAWSPDGNTIALVCLDSGWSDLYTLDIHTGALTRLTNDPYDERDPDWSPDGATLAFASDRGDHLDTEADDATFEYGQYDIYTLVPASKTMTRRTRHPARDLFPVWGPDNRRLLFVSERSGIGNITLYDLDDGSSRTLTDSLTSVQQLDWSKDGKKVVFTAFQEGGYDLFLMTNPLDASKTPTSTELARRLFASSLTASGPVPTVEQPPEPSPDTDASAPTVSPAKSPEPTTASEPLRSTLVPGIPRSLSELGDTPATPEENPDAPKETPPKTTEAEPRVQRKFARPQPYRPKMTVEGFGVFTQISSFAGFSGQAYLSMSDLLGNQRLFVLTDQSISSLKNVNAIISYAYLRNRLDYGVTAFHTRDYYLANESSSSNRIVLVADRNVGLEGVVEYPLSQFARFEAGVGVQTIYRDRIGISIYDYDRVDAFGSVIREVDEEPLSHKGLVSGRLAYAFDNVGYGEYGPVDGRRWRLEFAGAPGPADNYLRFVTGRLDYREYFRVGESQSVALRASGGNSRGRNAQKFFLGGLSTEISPRISDAVDEELRADEIFFPSFEGPLRGTDLYEYVGNTFALLNAEWRFRLVERATFGWPLPVTFRNVGGAFFADVGTAFDMGGVAVSDGRSRRHRFDLDNVVGGIGVGGRANLGVFVLRLDVAWRATRHEIAHSPRYYWSIGADY
jgi:hypothetical protein